VLQGTIRGLKIQPLGLLRKGNELPTVDEVSPAATTPLIAAGDNILVFAAQASHSFLPVGGDGQYYFYLVSAIPAELCPAL